MIEISCTNCRRVYPESGLPFHCPVCGGIYDYAGPLSFDSSKVDYNAPGIWRYRQTFELPEIAPEVTLGEGNTELAWRKVFGREVAFKLEYNNPTGAYHDRGSAVLCSFLRSRGVDAAFLDSSGNSGISFAAYAVKAGIQARIMVPNSTSLMKRKKIEANGAQVVRIMGPRSNSASAALRAAENGEIYASHAYLPQVISGYATMAYELYEQLSSLPGALIAPVGHGNLLLGLGKGFQAMQSAGMITKIPRLVGVQALACAPLWATYQYGSAGLGWVAEGDTVAEGIRIKYPVRGDAVLHMVRDTCGLLTVVDEHEINHGRDELSELGFNVEPTAAIIWGALVQVIEHLPDPVVVILTGAG